MDLAIYVWHPCDWPAVCMARTPQAKLSMRREHRGASPAGLAVVEEGRVVDSGDADEGTVNASASAAAALPACLPRHAGAAAAPRPAGEMLLAGASLPSPSERPLAAATTTLAAEIAEADVTAPALPPPAIRVAVEADGPFHWTFPGPPRPTGSTLLRNRALANRGWRLVSVPQHEWDAWRSVGGETMVRWAGAREVWGACGSMGDEMALGAGAGREATWDGALSGAAGSGGGAATGASGAATDSGATDGGAATDSGTTDGATDSGGGGNGGGATGGSGAGLDKVRGGGGYASAAVAVAAAAGLSQSAPAEDVAAGHVIDRVQYIRQKLDAALAAEGGLAAFKHIGAMVQQGQHQGHLCRHTA